MYLYQVKVLCNRVLEIHDIIQGVSRSVPSFLDTITYSIAKSCFRANLQKICDLFPYLESSLRLKRKYVYRFPYHFTNCSIQWRKFPKFLIDLKNKIRDIQ